MQAYRASFEFSQVYSGLKGSLSWQAHPKSAWSAASNPLVTGSIGASDHAVAFAGLTNRCWSWLLHFFDAHTHIQQHAFLLLCSRSVDSHSCALFVTPCKHHAMSILQNAASNLQSVCKCHMSLAAQGSCLSCSGAVEVLKLSLRTGEVVSQASYSAPRSIKLGSSVVLRNSLVAAISSDGHQLCSAKLEGEQTWPET